MLAAVLILIAIIALVWLVGLREPVYRLRGKGAAWFIALRGDRQMQLAPGAILLWQSEADFVVIGAETSHWTRFAIVRGATPPLANETAFDDCYIARIHLFFPPALALGLIKVLVLVGVLSRPRGAITEDAQNLGFRAELMPSANAIATLLSQPATYAPAMVNFLRYNGDNGAAAYRKYGVVALRTVYRTGGALLFYAHVLSVERGPKSGLTLGAWDELAAMRYPHPPAILSMEHVPQYRAALKHRDKGLAATVVIASHELPRA